MRRMRALIPSARIPVVLLAVLTAGCGGAASLDSNGPGSLTGAVAALEGAPPRAYAEVEAVSLVDASIAAATTSREGRYTLSLDPGPYILVARTSGLPASSRVTTGGTVNVSGRSELTLPPLAPIRLRSTHTAPDQGLSGSVVGIPPIPMSGPAAFGLGPDAAGSLVTGMLGECRKRNKKLVDLDPEVRDAISREQQLSDQGRLASPIHVNPLNPDVTIEGSVTVGADGTPLVDLTIRDARTGEVIRHIVLRGDPGDALDIGTFLRGLGPGLAAEACERSNPTPTPDAPASTPQPGGAEPGQLRFAISGPGSLDYFVWADGERRVCPPACVVPLSQFRSDIGIQRARNLTPDQESGARLVAWGGACSGLDALSAVRGGTCYPRLDAGGAVVVATFELRPKLTVRVIGAPQSGSFTFDVHPPQDGVPPAAHRFDCATPPCEWSYFFDRGSEVRLVPDGTQTLRRWDGACAGVKGADERGGLPEPCTLTLLTNSEVLMQRSRPSCISTSPGSISCTFEPP